MKYFISKVRYNLGRTHISQLLVHENNNNSIGTGSVWSKDVVVSSIKKGNLFTTVFQKNGTWYIGEDVRAVSNGHSSYLRTDNNNFTSDNLGNLPEF